VSVSVNDSGVLFKYKMRIGFDGYDPDGDGLPNDETLTNFPVLVVFSNDVGRSGFSYDGFASREGHDLRFTADNGVDEIPHQTETWDPDGASFVWVKVDELADTNSCIWAYWGLASATEPFYASDGSVWNANYLGIWHASEVPSGGALRDSTASLRNLTSYNMEPGDLFTNGAAVGAALDFDGDDEYLDRLLDGSGLSAFTISFWVQPHASSGTRGFVQWADQLGDSNPFLLVNRNAANEADFYADGGYRLSDEPLAENAWHAVAVTADGDDWAFYVDGVRQGTYSAPAPHAMVADAERIYFANGYNGYADGRFDEMRASDTARSPDWLWACYMTAASNATFNTYGRVENIQPFGTVLSVR
jgi:hypothetical protein